MNGPTLPIRRVGIDTWRENVVFLHRDCPVVRAAGFQALSKVASSNTVASAFSGAARPVARR